MALLIIPVFYRELEVRTATYGPGIDQSQHAKSVSHIINIYILRYIIIIIITVVKLFN